MDGTALIGGLRAAREGDGRARELRAIREAAEGFEALLYRELLTSMRKAQLDQGLFGDTPGGNTMEGLFEMTLSQAMAQGGTLGLAESMAGQLAGPGATDPADGMARLQAALRQVSGPRADEYGAALSPDLTAIPVEGDER